MIRLVHLIAGLEVGGAQLSLLRLVSDLDKSQFSQQVISLTGTEPVGSRIQSHGVPVWSLGMKPGVPNPAGLRRLTRWLRRNPCDIIQTWMYHSDLIGGLAAKLDGRPVIVWGVRFGFLRLSESNLHTVATARTCALLSRFLPDSIVCCSEASRRWHQELGYAQHSACVIRNGFDTEVFQPDKAARIEVRKELGVPDEAPIIGLVARYDPFKDHHNFIRAAAVVRSARSDVHFLLCGPGIGWTNDSLAGWIDAAGLRSCFHLLGQRDDIVRITAAQTIAATSSSAEGLPNVIGEAMACGIPCVVTDVGGSAELVGDTGKVVPKRDPQALAQAMVELLELGETGRIELGLAARRRIQECYSLSDCVARYQALYKELMRDRQDKG